MADEALLKTKSTLDNRDFNKGVQQMKKEMRDLDKVSSDAFAAIGNAIGIDTRQIQQFSSALAGLGNKLTQTGKEGSSAFSSIAKSITPVAAGIAGLGLAAAIAAFKQLNAEADAFELTIQGGRIKAQTDAYLETFKQSLRDQKGFGEAASEARSSWKESLARFWAGMNPMNNLETLEQADQAGQEAKRIAGELYDIELQRKENLVKIAELDAQIAQKREIISDTSRSTAERAAAIAAAQGLIKDKLNLQLPLAEKQRNLIIEMNALASDQMKDLDAEIAAKIQVNSLIQQEAAEQRTLLKQQNQINELLRKDNELRSKTRGSNVDAVNADFGLNGLLQVPVQPILPTEKIHEFKEHWVKELGGGLTLAIAIDPDSVEKIHDITKEIESAVEKLAVSVGESIGEMMGALIKGEDPWQAFANSALSALGDMAVSVGKMAISTGVATLGIKAALESLNGYVAIAAGVALVALGTAVKSGLSSIASGNYSASTNVASSGSYSSGINNYEQRDVYVNVTGTLRADGNELVAVLSNTNRKNKVTT